MPQPINVPVEDMPIEVRDGDLITRYAEWGDLAVRHLDLPAGTDLVPALKGLPNDRCASPHWGMILEGALHLEHADGQRDVAHAGEAYFWPAGHLAWTDERTVFFEVGPVAEMRRVHEHLTGDAG